MLSENPNNYITSTGEPSSPNLASSSKNITNLLGMILLLGTHADRVYKFMFDEKVHTI